MDANGPTVAALLTSPQRWGWEYVEPLPARPKSHLGPAPELEEPERSQREWKLRATIEDYRRGSSWRVGGVVLLALLGLVLDGVTGWVSLLLAAGAAWLFLVPWISSRFALHREVQAHRLSKKQARSAHRETSRQWEARLSTWDEDERARVRDAKPWIPVVQEEHSLRVEVFGGTTQGWSALLTTFGASALADGGTLLVFDFSEQNVAAQLRDVASATARPTQTWSLPAQLGALNYLGGLGAEDVADLLAEAVHALRNPGSAGGEEVSLRLLDAQLLRKAADPLGGDITVARLRTAVDALLHVVDPRAAGPLSVHELAVLSEEGDLLAGVERVRDELLYLRSCLELLNVDTGASPAAACPTDEAPEQGPAAQGWWVHGGLVLVSTDDDNARRKELIDHVLLQVLLRRLRAEGEHPDRTLVLVGADHLGQRALEALRRRAHSAGVRCVLPLEHLRGDAAQLLGSSGSTSVIMRLGNAAEAASAAEFIGKGHRFRLSQLSRQRGGTTTTGGGSGTSTSLTETDSRSTGRASTSGSSVGGGGSMGVGTGGFNLSFSSPVNVQRSESSTSSTSRSVGLTSSRQQSQNWSSAQSQTDGVVVAESYVFTVEPTQLQSLAETAFMLIETGREGRRLVAGNCDPEVVKLEGVDFTSRSPAKRN